MRLTAKLFSGLLFFGTASVPAFCAANPGADLAPPERARLNTARVPFIRNAGQIAEPAVAYYARTFGGAAYVLNDGRIVYSLPKFDSKARAGSAALSEIFSGGFTAEPRGAGKSAVAVSSFIGNQPEQWKANLPAFDQLDLGEVYDGISLLLAAHGNNVEKIFVVAPGADPRQIVFHYEGARHVEITPEGQLEAQTALGPVYFSRPVAWQMDELDSRFRGNDMMGLRGLSFPTRSGIQNSSGSTPVEVAYALDEDGNICFELAAYDQNKILVIDPLLASTFIGGGGVDAMQAIAVDSQTNIYVAGYTDSSDFPVTNGYSSSLAGNYDVCVSKFNADLATLVASTYLGGSADDQAAALAIDGSARIWIAGYTASANFPTLSAKQASPGGSGDAFVAILTSNLNSLAGSTYLGGAGLDSATAIAVDNSSQRQYIAGYTESSNFPVTNAVGYSTNYHGGRDAFVVLFSNAVSSAGFQSGTFLGGAGADAANALAIEPGNTGLCVAGSTASSDFPVTNANQSTPGGGQDAFVSRFDAQLTNLVGSTFLGGSDNDIAYGIGVGISNSIYVAGSTRSSNFPRNPTNNFYLGSWTNRYWGGQDIFVTCLTNNLTNLVAATFLGGPNDDVARCLIATTNIIFLAGYTSSTNFPVTRAAYDRSWNGGQDAFLLRIDQFLTNLAASTYLGGGANDQALALALGPETNLLFAAGITASSDFPSSDTAYQNILAGGASDGFVSKMPATLAYGTVKWKKFINGICSSPALTLDGNVMVGMSTSLIAYTRSGTERWRQRIVSVAEQAAGSEGMGAPAVGTNNIIYVNTTSQVYSISSTGAVNWVFNSALPATFWSAIAFNNEGSLFLSQMERLYCLSKNGAGIWTNTLRSYCDPAPAVSSSGIVYAVVSPNPGWLYDFNSAGATSHLWTTVGNIYASPVPATNNRIYVSSDTRLYAFNADGTTAQVWTASGQIYSSPAIGTNGVVYIGGGNDLYAFNPNGTTARIWRAGGEVKSSPALAADGSIIVGSVDSNIYCFNSNGTTNWVFAADDETWFQSPLLDSEGNIFVSDDSSIYALYGAEPLADSAWPCFRHDALRTANQGINLAGFLRPTGLAVTKGATTNYIGVGWRASSNALSYELWRSLTNSTATATRLRRLTQTNYNDSAIEPGRIYYYWVKVKTPVVLSSFSAPDSGGVPPFPATGLTASDGVPTNYVQVAWLASSNATTYYVYRSLSDDTNTAALIGSSAATNYSDATVAPGVRHYYWVTAANAEAGASGFSAGDGGGIQPAPPAGLAASQGAAIHQLSLSWNSSTGASSYFVYRNTEDNSSGAAVLQETAGLALDDSAIVPMRRYYYWLRATNEFGLSGFSQSAYGWGLLAAPQALSASAGAFTNLIRVSWEIGSTDATAHVVFRSESPDAATAIKHAEVVYNASTATNYDDTGITLGLTYYYWAAAKNSYGSSAWTFVSSPGGTPPSTPTDLSATDGALSNMIYVAWNAAPGALYYTVYRAETYDVAYAGALGSTLTNYFEDRSATLGVLYYYWVKAANNYGLGGLSTFNSGWRGMVPPDSVAASDGISTSEVIVSWSQAPNAALYEVWRGTSSNVASAGRLANNISVFSYSDTSAEPGAVYYYWVKAKRGFYVSAFGASDYGYRAIGPLDLGVSDFVFVPPTMGLLAKPAAVSFKVANLSAIDLVEPNNAVRYDFYLSRNPVYGADETYWFGGTNTALTLSAGAATRVVLSKTMRAVISVPVWATGSYYVFVFVNHTLPSGWNDPNLANNVARRFGDSVAVDSATAFQPVWNDFDGDGKSDFAVYRPASGAWLVWLSGSGYAAASLTGIGSSGARAVPRDYDDDGRHDPAVYHEASGAWLIYLSASGYQSALVTGWGGTGWQAAPADYDADGRIDPAVYQSATGEWRVWLSASAYALTTVSGLGGAGWQAVVADYDGDGYADPAVYQETTGTWRVWLSAGSYTEATVSGWGGTGWQAAPADYDADGRIDPAVYQSATGEWRVWLSSQAYRLNVIANWGGAGQKAVPGDYDGDGRADPVVYWESTGIWRVWLSSSGYQEMNVLLTGGEGFQAITMDE